MSHLRSFIHFSALVPALALGLVQAADVLPATPPVPPTGPQPTLEERIQQLDRQVRLLQAKAGIADESTVGKSTDTAKPAASDSGLVIASPDKAFSLKIGGQIQADGRFYVDDDQARKNNMFLIRRARIILSGTLWDWVDYRLMPDFSGTTPILQDAYLDAAVAPEFKIQVGKFKPAVGLERLQFEAYGTFIEAGQPTNLVPNRDIGAQIHGDLFGGTTAYALGVFNGVPDGVNADATATSDNKTGVARVYLTPWKNVGSYWLSGLSFGAGSSFGNEHGWGAANIAALPQYKTFGQNNYFQYGNAVASGSHWRLSPQLYWSIGSFGLLSEYAISDQVVQGGAQVDSIRNSAWQVAISWLITGEKATFYGVKPLRPFAPGNGNWGAWEIAARITGLKVDDNAFDDGFASRITQSSADTEFTVGLSWYLSRNLRWQLNYAHSTFENGGGGTVAAPKDREAENAVITRFQILF